LLPASSDQPEGTAGRGCHRRTGGALLFGLAPGGVYHAASVTRSAVSSYLAFSPLPPALRREAVCFLWHFPSRRRDWALPSTLPLELGLSSPGVASRSGRLDCSRSKPSSRREEGLEREQSEQRTAEQRSSRERLKRKYKPASLLLRCGQLFRCSAAHSFLYKFCFPPTSPGPASRSPPSALLSPPPRLQTAALP
jgi:hypothetical protein